MSDRTLHFFLISLVGVFTCFWLSVLVGIIHLPSEIEHANAIQEGWEQPKLPVDYSKTPPICFIDANACKMEIR